MRTPVDERELIVSYYTDQDIAQVYTSDYNLMAKFDKNVKDNPDVWKHKRTEKCQGDIVGKAYECPVSCVFFRAKPLKTRPRTEEEKEAFIKRMREYRESKNS